VSVTEKALSCLPLPQETKHVTNDPIEFITSAIPGLFNAGVADMKAAADQGDADAKKRYEDLKTTVRGVRVSLEGKSGADLYLLVKDAKMVGGKTAPSEPVTLSIAVAKEALEVGLEEMGEMLDKLWARAPKRIARLSPTRSHAFFEKLSGEKLKAHYVIKDTPDFDEVRVKVGFGSPDVAEKPLFSVSIDYDTLEELREGKLRPQAIMGRLQISGDAARAMQLGMEIMQR
jgi:hypothetical protein